MDLCPFRAGACGVYAEGGGESRGSVIRHYTNDQSVKEDWPPTLRRSYNFETMQPTLSPTPQATPP